MEANSNNNFKLNNKPETPQEQSKNNSWNCFLASRKAFYGDLDKPARASFYGDLDKDDMKSLAKSIKAISIDPEASGDFYQVASTDAPVTSTASTASTDAPVTSTASTASTDAWNRWFLPSIDNVDALREEAEALSTKGL